MGPQSFDENADSQKIYKYIVGEESYALPQEMTDEEVNGQLNDPFAELLLKKKIFPLTTNNLIEAFEKTIGILNGLKKYSVFHIAEGGQIAWNRTTDKINRTFRLVFSLETIHGIGADVLISTGTLVDSEKQFLQLMSWDPKKKAFNFYQRINRLWIWAGSSFHALEPTTRNKGPFSGHVNGGPVMKELKLPWQNWSSMNAQIEATCLSPDDPFLNHRFFKDSSLVKGAETLEKIIEGAFGHWNDARFEQGIKDGKISNFHYFLRQILDRKNFNLISSARSSQSIDEETTLTLPFSFFSDTEAFSIVGLNLSIKPVQVSGKFYLEALTKFDFSLVSNGTKLQGDTHFAFFVPQAASEDHDLLRKMIQLELLSEKLAACLLMVDFTNPIFSLKRESLIQYIPQEISVGKKGNDLDEKFIKNITATNRYKIEGTPEFEFINNWNIREWKSVFSNRLIAYFEILRNKTLTSKGYEELVLLAESRRSLFKETKLFEFPLTFAVTNINSEIPLEITPEGVVRPRTL